MDTEVGIQQACGEKKSDHSREEGAILHVNFKPALPRTIDKVKGKQEKQDGIHAGERIHNLKERLSRIYCQQS